MAASTLSPRQVPVLLRGEPQSLLEWAREPGLGRLAVCFIVIVMGAGCFGAAMGLWRAPLQAAYCAVKLPLIVLLTTLGNGLLNAMLAPLLGLNITARQSIMAVLMSFTIAAAILGAFSPLLAYLIWNLPSLGDSTANDLSVHSVILLTETSMIAFAGIASNIRLAQLLRTLCHSSSTARKVLFAWLAGNLLLGSQLAWLARPFVGSPGLPVQFVRPDALEGSFFEALLRAARHLLFPQ